MNKPLPSVFDQALNLLSYREHSAKELYNKLKAKGYDADEISPAIQRLEEMNYLNDERFAEIFVRSRISKPLGKNRILQELKQKGVKEDLIHQAIQNQNIDWFELARRLKERRFGNQVSKDFKEKSKQSRYLLYRGFDFEQINYALSTSDEDNFS